VHLYVYTVTTLHHVQPHWWMWVWCVMLIFCIFCYAWIVNSVSKCDNCEDCVALKSHLQEALSELKSVQLIIELLQEECNKKEEIKPNDVNNLTNSDQNTSEISNKWYSVSSNLIMSQTILLAASTNQSFRFEINLQCYLMCTHQQE